MSKEYVAFIEDPGVINQKVEMAFSIQELTPKNRRMKYRSRYVKAAIFPNPKQGKDDILWLRYLQGERYPKPFGVKILEELGPFEIKEKSVFTA